MKKTLMITDSASDITEQEERSLGIRVLPFAVTMGEKTYLSRVDFDNEEFYRLLAEFSGIPATSQITPFAFQELYAQLLEEGWEEVLLVLINAQGSATYDNSLHAAERFYDEHPGARERMRIRSVDARSYTCAYGYAVVAAAKMARAGVDADEIYAYLLDWMSRSRIYAGLYTLKYAAKSGRIPSAAAFVGDAIGMKPIMRIEDGGITTRDRVRGEKNIIPFVVRRACAEMEPGSPYCVVYGCDAALEQAVREAMTAAVGYPPAASYQIGAAIAINAGPRVSGVMFRRA